MKRMALLSILIGSFLVVTGCAASSGAAPTTAPQPSPAAGGGTQVNVTLADNTINSSLTTFKAGVPYTFVIRNNGNHLHNFNIAPPASVSGSLDASLAQALLVVTQDKLPMGGGTAITYTFPASAVGMQLEFSCLIPRHYEDGMRLAITVTN
jgi:uncharacterized cupredoxin-like copper-binding protein